MVRPRFYRNLIDSPGTASRAIRGRTKIPGDNSPGGALCAVRASGSSVAGIARPACLSGTLRLRWGRPR